MAEMDLQIKIEASGESAKKAVNDLSKAFGSLRSAATSASSGLTQLGRSMDNVSKGMKKFGRDFTTNITLPIAGLAGLSLKKIFDEAFSGQGSSAMNTFAAEIQSLKRNFDELLKTIGTQLAPMATDVAAFLNNMITAFRSLSPETRAFITNFALIAAAIGPIMLAGSAIIGILGKLSIALGGIISVASSVASALASPAAVLTTIGVAAAGAVNAFLKLKEAGVETGDALMMVFKLMATAVGKYIGGTILTGIQKVIEGLGWVVGLVNEDMASAFRDASKFVGGFVEDIDRSFQESKSEVDASLQAIGSSAADAFTFGLTNQFKINNPIQRTKEALQTDEPLFSELEEDAEQAAFDMIKSFADAATSVRESMASDMASGFLDFAEGAKTAEQAFNDFAKSTLRRISQMVMEMLIMRSLFPAGGAVDRGLGGLFASAGGFATGGYVSGPGTGTSDSILARLSNGEYVNDAKTVRTFGADFFRSLKGMAHGGLPKRRGGLPAFADGGLVTSSSSAPQVVIQNTGTPKNVQSTEFDPVTAVTTVILEDMSKNGSISKSMQNTFGMKRRGFT